MRRERWIKYTSLAALLNARQQLHVAVEIGVSHYKSKRQARRGFSSVHISRGIGTFEDEHGIRCIESRPRQPSGYFRINLSAELYRGATVDGRALRPEDVTFCRGEISFVGPSETLWQHQAYAEHQHLRAGIAAQLAILNELGGPEAERQRALLLGALEALHYAIARDEIRRLLMAELGSAWYADEYASLRTGLAASTDEALALVHRHLSVDLTTSLLSEAADLRSDPTA